MSTTVTVYIPAFVVLMVEDGVAEAVAPVLQLYVTAPDDDAVNVTVLVFGWQLMPMVELLVKFNTGATLVPNTSTVMDVLLQPVSVFVTVKLYCPFWFTCIVELFGLPTTPGPDHVYVKFAEGVNVGAMVTIVFAHDMVCAVPVPATMDGAVVALATETVVVDIQPLVATITPVYVPAVVNVTTLVLVGPDIPADGLHEYDRMDTVDVKPTVTIGDDVKQVMLGFELLNVKVGALVFGDTVAIAAAAEQPLAPVAINENVPILEAVTSAVAVFAPLNIFPPAGAIHV